MSEQKPKAKIKFVGYEVSIDNMACKARTIEKARELAKEWELSEIAKWKKENNQRNKTIKRNDLFWYRMLEVISYLKLDAIYAGKNQQPEKVAMLRDIREKIQGIMQGAERDSQ